MIDYSNNFYLVENNQQQQVQFLEEKRKTMQPPIAPKKPQVLNINNEKLVDDYAWLKEYPKVENPKIIDYLNQENAYYKQIMGPLKAEEDAIYHEILGRIKLQDSSVPIQHDNYYYYTRTEEDSNHIIFCRKKDNLDKLEEIILDANILAKKSEYFNLGAFNISANHQMAAYSSDINGSERFTINIKDLNNNTLLNDVIEGTIGSIVWHNNNQGFFYAKLNDDWRTDKVFYHKLSDDPKNDKLIITENDPLFRISIDKSTSERFVLINRSGHNSNDVWYIDMHDAEMTPKLIAERKDDHQYEVSHHKDFFYISTNNKGRNFRLVKAPIEKPQLENWQEIIAHDPNIYLVDFDNYEKFFTVTFREQGLNKIKIYDYDNLSSQEITFPDSSYQASTIYTDYKYPTLRISYTSLNTPISQLEYNLVTKKTLTLKTQEIPSGYNKDLYKTERIWATSTDGIKVPISLVYKKELFKNDGSNPLYLYGYGSYGYAIPPAFRPTIISLLDRGFVYAIAHIRGGDDLGYDWYESAKFLNKKHTFNDFMSSAEYLISKKYTDKGNIVISGGSAGGMLMGVCLNEKPHLYKAAIADVPFVDVLNTMLDEKLPLTPGEFKEWGNPKDPEYFNYIKSYSPYDNVKKQAYPNIYVTAGLNDPRVTYWEPAKWVAKLRDSKTDNNIILLNTNMDAGHAGASGRFGTYRDKAKEFNFIFKIFDIRVN
jgi:oligopeptidase B